MMLTYRNIPTVLRPTLLTISDRRRSGHYFDRWGRREGRAEGIDLRPRTVTGRPERREIDL